MRRIKRILSLLRRGKLLQLFKDGVGFLSCWIHGLGESLRDRRYGGISAARVIPSKHADEGAYQTQSSDYRCLRRVFRDVPLREDDVFADVGCGEGRVLTWLHSKGFRGKAYGIELDEEAAKTARKRCARCKNVRIVCGNVLEQVELFRAASAVYLFNPFSRSVFQSFVSLLEATCEKPVRLYYLNDVYVRELDAGGRWTLLKRGVIRRTGCRPMPFSVHRLEKRRDP